MRIVGGRLGGRTLAGPKSQAIRPTSDRLRESLFNILAHAHGDPVTGARVLDLFAGTGALGLEAMSRGASFALLIDDGAEARALMRQNVEALGLGGVTRIFRRDATKLGPVHPLEPFSLVFLTRPIGTASPSARSPRCAPAAGSRPTRSSSSRRRPTRSSRRRRDFAELDRRRYDDSEFVFLGVAAAEAAPHVIAGRASARTRNPEMGRAAKD